MTLDYLISSEIFSQYFTAVKFIISKKSASHLYSLWPPDPPCTPIPTKKGKIMILFFEKKSED